MSGLYLDSRLSFLRASQNPDGGWGYFPGKQSWLEPTTYAMLALHGTASDIALARGSKLLYSWQLPDGSFRPNGAVGQGTWVTALAVTLGAIFHLNETCRQRAIDSLLNTVGAEHGLAMRAMAFLHLINVNEDLSHEGWPWRPGNASWIEPTSHTLVALKKVARGYRAAEVDRRIRDGEALVMTRRCSDGGWNHGAQRTLNFDLPSYPESTGIALLGLLGCERKEIPAALDLAARFHQETKSSLAKAWLEIALRCHGRNLPGPVDAELRSTDIMLAALEALGHPEGNYGLFCPGARS